METGPQLLAAGEPPLAPGPPAIANLAGTQTESQVLLNILEFNSTQKRLSVIVRDDEGNLLLLCKGTSRLVKQPIIGLCFYDIE